MGKESALKAVRKQLRVITKENLPEVLANETVSTIAKDINQKVEAKLDAIEKAVTKEMQRQDTQSMQFRKRLIDDAALQITSEMFHLNTTLLAWQQLMAEKLGITDTEAFFKEVEDRRTIIVKQMEEEAKARQEAAAATAKAAEEAKAAAAAVSAPEPSAEAPAPAAEVGPAVA